MTITRRGSFGLLGGVAAIAAGCAPAIHTQPFDAEVIILGAGLSGLHAALTLQTAGVSVLVLEAASRVGGRMVTLDELPGQPEAGGSQVGQTYARIRSRCIEHGIGLEAFPPSPPGEVICVDGQLMDASDWPGAEINTLPAPWRETSPSRLFFSRIARSNPLPDVYAWREPAWQGEDVAAADWLTAQGAPPDALALMDVSLNGLSLDTYSMLNIWRTLTLYAQDREAGPSEHIVGGSQRLPEAMAAALGDAVRLSTPVVAITADPSGVTVTAQDGRSFRARRLITALPLPVLRRLATDIPFGAAQRAAIDTLSYTPILQLHLEAETPFWETDGFAPEMWTNSPLERIFAGRNRDGLPTGMLTAWMDGTGGLAADQLDNAGLEALARTTLAQIRPASAGRVRLRHVQRWTPTNPLAGGAYLHWQPGQIGPWAQAMLEPAGTVHMAGEHASYLHTGMEGAMEAGERAALEVLEALGV